ncbi:hypothetical protein LCGC14_1587550 [marine sediment metagenome]|uniref:DNA N-6-adenine-methyltransferase (Dam) n=1 Tax=marine sediment metagenome TaxID=412755 RepID=A0A0F9IFB6_9ZZZZ
MANAYMPQAKTQDWATPKALFDQLWQEFGGFDLDPCGQPELHYSAWKIAHHGGICYDGSTAALDGLTQPWPGKVYMNPPYGKQVGLWVAKAVSEVRTGNAELVAALLKATTDVKWWHEYVEGIVTPRFIQGRLKFGGQPGPAPFPSVIVVWTKYTGFPLAQPEAAPEQGAFPQ